VTPTGRLIRSRQLGRNGEAFATPLLVAPPTSFVEDEGNLHDHPISDELAVLDAQLLLLDPPTTTSASGSALALLS